MKRLTTVLNRHAGRAYGLAAGVFLAFANVVLGDGDPLTVGTAVESGFAFLVATLAGFATEGAAISRRTVNEGIDAAKTHAEAYIPEPVLAQLDDSLRQALLEAIRTGVENNVRWETDVRSFQR